MSYAVAVHRVRCSLVHVGNDVGARIGETRAVQGSLASDGYEDEGERERHSWFLFPVPVTGVQGWSLMSVFSAVRCGW